MKNENFDFSGWATRNDIKCSDGVTIRRDAFVEQDGAQVPLVWMHDHSTPTNVIGHAMLENRPQGVYAYCYLNDSPSGLDAKTAVQHGDVKALSIYANKVRKVNGNVVHGCIKELSLVLAGANAGAFIDNVIKHGEEMDDEIEYSSGDIITIAHSEDDIPMAERGIKPDANEDDSNEITHEDSDEEKDNQEMDKETVKAIYESMNDKQKDVTQYLVGAAVNSALKDADDADDEDEEDEEEDVQHSDDQGGEIMKHNVFDQQTETAEQDHVLSHADGEAIISLAKQGNVRTLREAINIYADENEISHADVGGFVQTGAGNVTTLFPEYQEVRPGAPELITNDQGWISVVMSKTHKSPISRIRTTQVDIRKIDSLRAKGYKTKGEEKKLAGQFKAVRRTTDPVTVYVKNALHRDDIVDITDFDYVAYLFGIDKMMLNEEMAMAVMLGDGRDDGDDDKIPEDKIRPIWKDDELYTIHVDLDIEGAKKELQGTNTGANFSENYIYAEAMIKTALYARENYRGTGTPDFFCTPHMLNVMLLARDLNGRRIYNTKAELAAALNVGDIYTAEQFEGKERTTKVGNKKKKLIGIMCNLADYSFGSTKGGEVTHFTQFDIDFNQEKSLLETRVSGALTRVYSAIAIEEDVTLAEAA